MSNNKKELINFLFLFLSNLRIKDNDKEKLINFLSLPLSSLRIKENRILKKGKDNEFKKTFKRFFKLKLKFSKIKEFSDLSRIILIY